MQVPTSPALASAENCAWAAAGRTNTKASAIIQRILALDAPGSGQRNFQSPTLDILASVGWKAKRLGKYRPTGWINAERPSRPRFARHLRMRVLLNAIIGLRHGEERPGKAGVRLEPRLA